MLAMESLDDSPFDGDPVPVEADPGTLVILHGRLPHLSGPNHSSHPRHAYTLHLIDGDARYPTDNWLKRDAALPLGRFKGMRSLFPHLPASEDRQERENTSPCRHSIATVSASVLIAQMTHEFC